jgi:S1-C subfamily serine protease
MTRILLFLLALLAMAAPARADDISAAGRGVVRVVVIAFNEDGEVSDFGHGSGFAVAPNRIVTNAHVVAMAQPGASVTVGVVPSQGHQAFRARVLTLDPARDLALLEVGQATIPPIPLYVGPLEDGAPVAALGYPGNVDLATARSAEDFITPLPPTRSVGIFSNMRLINGISLLLHTAPIAHGNSGGPLLDQCGRVIGVNTLITNNQDGDSSFGFAVSNRELSAFLRQAGQLFQTVDTPCISMADQMRIEQAQREAAARAADEAADARARRAADERAQALAAIEDRRDARIGIAGLLLALSLLAFQGAGFLFLRDQERHRRNVVTLAVGAGLLMLGAVVVFVTRPSLRAALAEQSPPAPSAPRPPPTRFVGRNSCRLLPERSRITVSSAEPVTLSWGLSGCANGHDQFVQEGATWTRVSVPDNDEQPVDIARFDPASGEYVVTRYLLDSEALGRLRAIRGEAPKSCAANEAERALLDDRQQQLTAALPRLPNERLVYSCSPELPGGVAEPR